MIFISYSSFDRDKAKKLASRLEEGGFEVWLDEWSIKVGDDITQKISEGLDRAKYLIVILTSKSVDSKWVTEEWNSVFNKQINTNKVIILPALFEDCKVPILLKGKKHANFIDFEYGLSQILDTVKGDTVKSAKLLEGESEIADKGRPSKNEKGEHMLNGLVEDLLTKGNNSLSLIMHKAFKVSKAFKYAELYELARFELEGYSKDLIKEGGDYKYRTVNGYIVFGKIEKIRLGLNESMEDFWITIARDKKFIKQSFIFPDTVNVVEEQRQQARLNLRGIFQITMNSSEFLDLGYETDITFIAKNEMLEILYTKIRRKLQSTILALL